VGFGKGGGGGAASTRRGSKNAPRTQPPTRFGQGRCAFAKAATLPCRFASRAEGWALTAGVVVVEGSRDRGLGEGRPTRGPVSDNELHQGGLPPIHRGRTVFPCALSVLYDPMLGSPPPPPLATLAATRLPFPRKLLSPRRALTPSRRMAQTATSRLTHLSPAQTTSTCVRSVRSTRDRLPTFYWRSWLAFYCALLAFL
jgi:hypothetical protein